MLGGLIKIFKLSAQIFKKYFFQNSCIHDTRYKMAYTKFAPKGDLFILQLNFSLEFFLAGKLSAAFDENDELAYAKTAFLFDARENFKVRPQNIDIALDFQKILFFTYDIQNT